MKKKRIRNSQKIPQKCYRFLSFLLFRRLHFHILECLFRHDDFFPLCQNSNTCNYLTLQNFSQQLLSHLIFDLETMIWQLIFEKTTKSILVANIILEKNQKNPKKCHKFLSFLLFRGLHLHILKRLFRHDDFFPLMSKLKHFES